MYAWLPHFLILCTHGVSNDPSTFTLTKVMETVGIIHPR